MRIFFIILAVVTVLWLIGINIQRNNINDVIEDNNNVNHENMEREHQINEPNTRTTDENEVNDNNPLTEERMNNEMNQVDTTEDKFDKKIEMPYEDKTTNENTNIEGNEQEKVSWINTNQISERNGKEKETETDKTNKETETESEPSNSNDEEKKDRGNQVYSTTEKIQVAFYQDGKILNSSISVQTIEPLVSAFQNHLKEPTPLNENDYVFKIAN